MDTVKTATGKTFSVASVAAIPSPPILYIRVVGASMGEVASVFSDPNETNVIEYAGQQLVGYSTLSAIVNEGQFLRVNLRR